MKKTVLGYFYRRSTETPQKALSHYRLDNLHKSVEETIRWIGYDKNQGIIGKTTKPKLLRLVIEEINETIKS